MGVNTILTHSGRGDQSVEVRSVNPVVMRASTILFKDYDTWQKYRKLRATDRVLSYGARGTTTNFELEKLVCELEGGYRAQLFPTGLAALAMVLLNYAEAGAHFIVSDAIYGPVRTVCNLFLSKVKVDVSFCKADCSDVESLIQPNTKPKSRRKTPRNPVRSRSFKLKVRETHGLFIDSNSAPII